MSLLHMGGSSGASVVAPEGVEFDGVTDYLSRSSDLVGNIDSKTFTFSCWVYIGEQSGSDRVLFSSYSTGGVYYGIRVAVNSRGHILITLGSADNQTAVVNAEVTDTNIFNSSYRWFHVLLSIDTSSTSRRSLFINDIQVSPTWTTYINADIGFTQNFFWVGAGKDGTVTLKGRLSNLFLDYTYRDLSIEANRRLFIDSNGNPA